MESQPYGKISVSVLTNSLKLISLGAKKKEICWNSTSAPNRKSCICCVLGVFRSRRKINLWDPDDNDKRTYRFGWAWR